VAASLTIPLDYPSGAIVVLPEGVFDAFVREGSADLYDAYDKINPDAPHPGQICLVMDEERFSIAFNRDGPFQDLLDTTRFGRVADDGRRVLLLPAPTSMTAFIENSKAIHRDQAPLLDLEPVKRFANLYLDDPRGAHNLAANSPPPEVPLRLPIYLGVLATAMAGESYNGQISECTCGEYGCGAEYAWFEDRLCLFLLETSSTEPIRARFFAFRVPEREA